MADSSDDTGREDDKKGSGGKSGSGSGGIRLPPNKLQEVMRSWEHLDINKVAAKLAEFFSEYPSRASANVEVKWPDAQQASLKNHGYAILTNFLKYGQGIVDLLQNLTRENAERLRAEYGIAVSGPSG